MFLWCFMPTFFHYIYSFGRQARENLIQPQSCACSGVKGLCESSSSLAVPGFEVSMFLKGFKVFFPLNGLLNDGIHLA